MFLNFHILQNFAPSCLNRDDTNSPKETTFGGYRRAKVSSACWKRAMRVSEVFRQNLREALGYRTRLLVNKMNELLTDLPEKERAELLPVCTDALYLLSPKDLKSGGQKKSKGKKTEVAKTSESPEEAEEVEEAEEKSSMRDVMIFVGHDELQAGAEILRDSWKKFVKLYKSSENGEGRVNVIKAIGEILKEKPLPATHAVDIGLFGRMIATRPDADVDGATCVAPAISTNELDVETDYFVAIDDLQPSEESGAGHVNAAGYNSATYYRYINLDVDQMITNCGGDAELAKIAIEAFIQAMILVVPTAKQHSSAAFNLPEYVLITGGNVIPISLANAFESPIRPTRDYSLVENSVRQLEHYRERLVKAYTEMDKPLGVLAVSVETDEAYADVKVENLDLLISNVLLAAFGGK